MKIPVSWLKDFVDIDISPEELGEKLVSCGFEIEEIIYQKDEIKNVRVGKILTAIKHPNADKLLLTSIDVGGKVLQIATSATNIKVGDNVPVAVDGAVLYGKTIKSGEMRGVLSEGMMCGGEELGLTEDDYPGAGVNGILILKNTAIVGADVNEEIGKNEVILDVSITANRADCNSILGIAREVAVVTDKQLKPLDLNFKSVRKMSDFAGVNIEEPTFCSRYMAQTVENIQVSHSPELICKRLRSVGLRPINNIVDITNYVLIEIGQPMHSFDLDLLSGKKINVRKAIHGEKIVALDGKEYALDASHLVIADTEKPIAIAGVMGGQMSSVQNGTKTIVFESARFARDSVRHTSKELNLRSDSSARYEKGVDFYAQEVGLKRALHLIDKYSMGTIIGCPIDTNPSQPEKVVITTPEAINYILGIEVPTEIMLDILNRLQMETTLINDEIQCKIPLFREDIVGKNDLAEEIIRIYGYNHIEPTLIKHGTLVKGRRSEKQEAERKVKSILTGKGMYEIVTYSFVSPKIFDLLQIPESDMLRNVIKVANPMGEDFSVMRTTLSHSMIKTLASNLQKGNKSGLFFEVAKTYLPKQLPITEYPIEKYKLSLGAYGDGVDFYSLKFTIEDLCATLGIEVFFRRTTKPFLHDTRAAEIIEVTSGTVLGYFGEVHPLVLAAYGADKRLYFAELDEDYLAEHTVKIRPFQTISKYPSVERDLALLVEKSIEAATILNTIKSKNIGILESAEIFDVYEGGQVPHGKKSVAVNLVLRSNAGTLVESEITAQINEILQGLEGEIHAVLR